MTKSPNHREDQREARLEAALRAALQHEQAPLGFTARVKAKLQAQTARSNGWRVLRPETAWLRIAIAAALLLAMVIPMGLRLRHQSEVAKGEVARQQVMLALRITGTQLRTIQHRTRFINASPLVGETQ